MEPKARFNIRWSPIQTLEGLQTAVTSIRDRHGIRYSLEWFVSGLPFYTPPGWLSAAVTRGIREVTGLEARMATGGGTPDSRYIAPMGARIVELGIVNQTFHKVNARVRVEDIDALKRTYERVMELLLLK